MIRKFVIEKFPLGSTKSEKYECKKFKDAIEFFKFLKKADQKGYYVMYFYIE